MREKACEFTLITNRKCNQSIFGILFIKPYQTRTLLNGFGICYQFYNICTPFTGVFVNLAEPFVALGVVKIVVRQYYFKATFSCGCNKFVSVILRRVIIQIDIPLALAFSCSAAKNSPQQHLSALRVGHFIGSAGGNKIFF